MAEKQTNTAAENSRSAAGGIFREKSIARVSSPEELNDYIRVTTPSVWLVLIALVVLLVGMLVWSIFGTVKTHRADGSVAEVHPIAYVVNGGGTGAGAEGEAGAARS